jgi:hypothetical protein
MDLASQAAMSHLPANTFLRKVVYDPNEQRGAVRKTVQVWLRTLESLLNTERDIRPQDLLPYPAIWTLQEALAEHHLCFKHPAFAEEREWRLIKLVDRQELQLLGSRASRERMGEMGVNVPSPPGGANAEGLDVSFRASPSGLVPYLQLSLRERAGLFVGRLPLWQVIQGPTQHPDLSLESLKMYLDSRGYNFPTEVKASRIPLRD